MEQGPCEKKLERPCGRLRVEKQDGGDVSSLSTWGPCCSLQNECTGTNIWTGTTLEAVKDRAKSGWLAQGPRTLLSTSILGSSHNHPEADRQAAEGGPERYNAQSDVTQTDGLGSGQL